jgi:hypothetical protein
VHLAVSLGVMTRSPHPDYLSVPAERRWGKSLEDLVKHLSEAAMKRRGQWDWYVLPGGALVAMRMNEENWHRELRIARRTAPLDPAGWGAWEREVGIFLEHFGGADRFERIASVEGTADVTYRMLLRGEKADGRCVHCGQPAEQGPYKEAVCTRCATRLGAEEAAARRMT